MSDLHMNILLVEDNPAEARLLLEELRQDRDAHFEVAWASSLADARKLLGENRYDVILLDLSLPDSFGLETVVQVRSRVPGIPIVVLSGVDDANTAVDAVRQGAQDYLVKGQINRFLLVRSIRYAIQRNQAEQEIQRARSELEIRVRERTLELRETVTALEREIQARNAAEQRHARLAAIVDSSDDAIVGLSLNGTILTWNNGAERIYGYSPDEAVGRNISILADTERAHEDEDMLEVLKQGRRIDHFQTVRRSKDGRTIYASLSMSPVLDEKGRVAGASVIGRDITRFRQMEAEVLKAGEIERQRIGRDLHDTLGQDLAAIKLWGQMLHEKLVGASSSEAAEALKITQLAAEAIELTRSLSRNLVLVGMEPAGLMKALEDLADHVSERFRVHCEFRCNKPILIHDSTTSNHLYYIIREAVTNAIKHAQARHIVVLGHEEDGRIVFTVQNDGSPLPHDYTARRGLGMKTMSYRATTIGASLEIKPNPAGGTILSCSLTRPAPQASAS